MPPARPRCRPTCARGCCGWPARHITAGGVLVIDARRYRTQARNREDALARLVAVLRRAAVPPKPRTATRVPKAVKEQRLEAKRRLSERKRQRRPPPAE